VRRLTIGEMAKLNNISSQTLRYYDQIGLIHPEWIDDATGYRYYDINQSAKLDLIYHMKSLGMSLESIRQLFEKKDIRLIEENMALYSLRKKIIDAVETFDNIWIEKTKKLGID